ncbi:MAG: MOSC domain-containing protein [Candidatus Rifleibacteriota bacterium]
MGRVISIAIAKEQGGPQTFLKSVKAIAGFGLEGDRYAKNSNNEYGNSAAITLIEKSSSLACRERLGIELPPESFRRNLVVDDIDLNSLVGKDFRVGSTLCRGYELCHPCKHLSVFLNADLLEGLKMAGGLRAYIIQSGIIRVGDEILIL